MADFFVPAQEPLHVIAATKSVRRAPQQYSYTPPYVQALFQAPEAVRLVSRDYLGFLPVDELRSGFQKALPAFPARPPTLDAQSATRPLPSSPAHPIVAACGLDVGSVQAICSGPSSRAARLRPASIGSENL